MHKPFFKFPSRVIPFLWVVLFVTNGAIGQDLCPPLFLNAQPLNGAVGLSWDEPDSLGGLGEEVFTACFPVCESAPDGFTIEHLGQDTSGGWFLDPDGETVDCAVDMYACSDGGVDDYGAIAIYSDTLAPVNSRLSTGPINLSNYTSAALVFDEFYLYSDYANDSNWVEVSTDGINWEPVYYSNPMDLGDGYVINFVDLTGFAGQSIYLGFRFYDSIGYNENWQIDNIRVFGGDGSNYENPCGTLSGYNVFQDGENVGFSETNSFVVAGLTNNINYCFGVSAVYIEGESVLAVEACTAPVDPFELTSTAFRDTLDYALGEYSTFEFQLINQDTAIHDFHFSSVEIIEPSEENTLLGDDFNTGESVSFFDPDGFWAIGSTDSANGIYLSYPIDSDGEFYYYNDGEAYYSTGLEPSNAILQSQAIPYDGSGPVFFILDMYFPHPYGGCSSGYEFAEDASIVVSVDNGATWIAIDSTITTAVTWSGWYAADETEANWHTLMYNITPYIEPGIFNVGVHYDDCGGNWSSGIGVDNAFIVQGDASRWLSWERLSGKIVSWDTMSVSLTMMPQENQNEYESAMLYLEGESMYQSVNIVMITDPDNIGVDTNTNPFSFALHQSFPNPFNPSTEIRYEIPDDLLVSVAVYDVAGRLIRSLINEPKPAGSYSVVWDGKNDIGANVATGVYIYSIDAGKHRQNKKTVFLK